MLFFNLVRFGFQDPATPIMEGIIQVHHYIMSILIFIFIFVCTVLSSILFNFYYRVQFTSDFYIHFYNKFQFYVESFVLILRFIKKSFQSTLKKHTYILMLNPKPEESLFSQLENFCDEITEDLIEILEIDDEKQEDLIEILEIDDEFFDDLNILLDDIEDLIKIDFDIQEEDFSTIFIQYNSWITFLNNFLTNFAPKIPDITLNVKTFRLQLAEGINLVHYPLLEICWTILPTILLYMIALPSFSLMYAMDLVVESKLTLKVTGHQWYWNYEF